MSFFRPEVVALLHRWREAIASGIVLALGLWWGFTSFGLLSILGWIVAMVGAALLWTSAQRARFRPDGGGLGMVEVDERQITYFGPLGGSAASIEALTEVALIPDRAGLPVWRFRSGMEIVTIPVTAAGTGALFDVLTALPGADIEAAIRASRGHLSETVVIWRRAPLRVH